MKKKKEFLRSYEAVVLFGPDLESEKLESAVSDIENTIKEYTKSSITIDNLGKRALTYRIKKFNEANYVIYHFQGEPQTVQEIKDHIKHNVNIIRTMFLSKGN